MKARSDLSFTIRKSSLKPDSKLLTLVPSSSGSFEYDYLPAILLPDAHNSYVNATILIESGNFVLGNIYQVMMGEKSREIKLTGLLAEGEDYEQVSFEWLKHGQG